MMVRSKGGGLSVSEFLLSVPELDSRWKLGLRLLMTKLVRRETLLAMESLRSSPLLLLRMRGGGRQMEVLRT